MSDKKILLITYYWPPAGGPGVQRWYKLTKYLVKQGFVVDVVTVSPEKANYPIMDHSLEEGFSKEKVRVYRTNNFDIFNVLKKFNKKAEYPISGFANSTGELTFKTKLVRKVRSRFFLPDPRKFWNKYALDECSNLLQENEYQSVITTSPPHSSQLIGLQLKKKFPKIQWVADLRDPWTDIYYYESFLHSAASKEKDLNYERKVISSSDKILVVGQEMKNMFANKYNAKIDSKIYAIPNGYDTEDIKSSSKPDPQFFHIVYTGTIASNYPLQPFISALEKVIASTKAELKLTFVGRVNEVCKNIVLSSRLAKNTEFSGYVSHQEAIDYMHKANLLLLIVPDHEHNKLHMSGKIFEYIAAHRPVISLGPTDGDAANVLKTTNSGTTFEYYDSAQIEEYLSERISSWKENPLDFEINNSPAQYSRENIALNLIKTLAI